MSVKEIIYSKMTEAMRAHDEDGKRVYRMALASIKFAEKEKKAELDDESALQIVAKELKIRREFLQDAEKAGRETAAEEARKDIAALEALLPKQLSSEELKSIIADVIAEVGAAGPADMGKVMKAVMPKVKGLAANDQISKTVRELLAQA